MDKIYIYILSNKNLLIKKYLNIKQRIFKLCKTKPNMFSFNSCGGCELLKKLDIRHWLSNPHKKFHVLWSGGSLIIIKGGCKYCGYLVKQ